MALESFTEISFQILEFPVCLSPECLGRPNEHLGRPTLLLCSCCFPTLAKRKARDVPGSYRKVPCPVENSTRKSKGNWKYYCGMGDDSAGKSTIWEAWWLDWVPGTFVKVEEENWLQKDVLWTYVHKKISGLDKACSIKRKIGKLDFIKIKLFCFVANLVERIREPRVVTHVYWGREMEFETSPDPIARPCLS